MKRNTHSAKQLTHVIIGDEKHPVTLYSAHLIARTGAQVTLSAAAKQKTQQSRAFIERIAQGERAVYGVNTGFGELSSIRIQPEQIADLQRNIARSHSSGVGEPLAKDVTRAMMFFLANSLSKGYSGVRAEVIETILALLNNDLTPVIPSRGSVGASGDLAPLAHLALTLMGEGEIKAKGKRGNSAEMMQSVGITPLELGAKEGLALMNGTHLMEAMGALAVYDSWRLLRAAEIAAGMSLEALMGSQAPFDARIHRIRPQPGQKETAARVLRMLEGSEIIPSHKDCGRVQDPYSIRCIPQVLGAVRDTLTHCEQVFSYELNAVTDNPLIFAEDEMTLSGGNFHGQPLAAALDFAAIAVAHMAGFSERRIYNLMGPHTWDVNGAPPFLTKNPGLHSGYMIAQYAAAALTNEINLLAHPASVGSLPTSAGMEDFVSMGATAGHKLLQSLELARNVIAIELICAAQGLEFRKPLKPGRGVDAAYQAVRSVAAELHEDRPPAPDIEHVAKAIADGLFDSALADYN